MAQSRVIGIDLGTTRCAVARIDELGRSAMVRTPQGDLLMPGIVFFEDEELVFGRAAKQAAVLHPNRAAEWIKRDFGQTAYSRAIGGELLPTELIEACLLGRLWKEYVGSETQSAVVLSVPTCFDQAQRRAALDACQIAGIPISATVSDTLATTLTFAENNGYLKGPVGDKVGCRVLVVDLGGGTLDVAVMELKPGRVRTMAAGGDARLGGRDWDLKLADYLAGEFARQYHDDPRHDMVSVRRLGESAEEAKQTLTARQQARVHIERFGEAADITVTREQFEEACEALVARTEKITQQVIGQAGMAWRDVEHLLLVGGATRMPMIGKMLERVTKLKAAPNMHPEEAVARGAALYAAYLLARREKKSDITEIIELTPYSLGFEWLDAKSQKAENVVIVPRGSEIPCGTSASINTTIDGQGTIVLQLLEGESRDAEECSRFAQATIRNLPERMPKGTPVEVSYQCAAGGRLQVKAQMAKSGQALAVEMQRTRGLSESQVADWRKLLGARPGFKAILAQLTRHDAEQPARGAIGSPLPVGQAIDASAGPSRGRATPPLDAFHIDESEMAMTRPKTRKKTPRQQLIAYGGHVVFALLGAAIGYYILVWLDPGKNFLQLPLPGLQRPASTSEAFPAKSR